MKVLLKTLQDDAPSLKTYEDGKAIDVTSNYTKAYQSCLIKSPEKRPSIEKLLELKFFSKCLDISIVKKDIGGLVPPLEETPDDYVHKKLEITTVTAVGDKVVFSNEAGESEYVPGTTWNFSVGSSTTDTTAPAAAATAAATGGDDDDADISDLIGELNGE